MNDQFNIPILEIEEKKPEEDREEFVKRLESIFDMKKFFKTDEVLRALLMDDQECLSNCRAKCVSLEAQKKAYLDAYDAKGEDVSEKRKVVGSVKINTEI